VTWGAYLPGLARTVVNCNQDCNHRPGGRCGAAWQVAVSCGLGARPGRLRGRACGEAAEARLLVAAVVGLVPMRSAHREERAARLPHIPAVLSGGAGLVAAVP